MAGIVKMMAVAGVVAGALLSTAANAAVTSLPGDQPVPAGATLIDFNSNTIPNGFSLTGNYAYATGTTSTSTAPTNDSTQYLVVNSTPGATLKVTNGASYDSVGFYWGSADTFNTLTIRDTANNILKVLTGGDIAFPGADNAGGDWSNLKYNRYVTYTLDNLSGLKIGSVNFASDRQAFELDNVSFFNTAPTSVPEPATLTLFGAGIAGLVAASRRRRNKAA